MENTEIPRKRRKLQDWEEPEELKNKDIGCKAAVFTWNNYPEDWWTQLLKIPHRYLIGAEEIAPTTGTPHIQGYIQFEKLTKWGPLAKKFHLSFKTAYGNPKQNYEYCRKIRQVDIESGKLPNGVWKESGKLCENDGSKIKKLYEQLADDIINENLNKKDLLLKYPKYIIQNGYKKYEEIRLGIKGIKVTTLPSPCGLWIYGESGKGKSTYARLLVGVPLENVGLNKTCLLAEKERQYYYPKQWNKWWDGYEFQDNVIADDMGLDHCKYRDHLKHWADEIQFNCEIKGAMAFIRPKKFIITSQYSPSQMWSDKETLDAIYRRFKIIKVLGYDEETKGTDIIDMTRDECECESLAWREEKFDRDTSEEAKRKGTVQLKQQCFMKKVEFADLYSAYARLEAAQRQ